MDNKFAVIVSQFNHLITEKLLQGTVARLTELGCQSRVFHVPGAIEIPLTAQLLAKTKNYHAIICLGAIIRGETDHYTYVCQQVSAGCLQVMLNYELPVIFGILTTNNLEQALDRVGGSEGHKGIEAANTAFAMAKLVRDIS